MNKRLASATAVFALLAAGPAFAGHARPGLWSVTTTIETPNVPALTPEQVAKMKASGVQMTSANTFTAQHCVTPQEAAMDVPATAQRHQGCTMGAFKLTGNTMTAKLTCAGEPNTSASGEMSVTYDSQTHYIGHLRISGLAQGRPVTLTNRFEGKWMAADCGTINH